MKKRFKFKCWKCHRTYTLFREITDQQKLIVGCPYCNQEAVVDLDPFRKKIIPVQKGDAGNDEAIGYEYQLPEVLPTQKSE
jgi:DNA-directed RNA polymerase subunit RPC12/RpoP